MSPRFIRVERLKEENPDKIRDFGPVEYSAILFFLTVMGAYVCKYFKIFRFLIPFYEFRFILFVESNMFLKYFIL